MPAWPIPYVDVILDWYRLNVQYRTEALQMRWWLRSWGFDVEILALQDATVLAAATAILLGSAWRYRSPARERMQDWWLIPWLPIPSQRGRCP